MSAVAASVVTQSPIRVPQDLDLPPEVAEVLEALTDEGRRDYVRQLMEALAEAQLTNDLRAFRTVIEAHYRTLLFVRHPRYAGMKEAASKPPTRPMTAQEFRKKLVAL